MSTFRAPEYLKKLRGAFVEIRYEYRRWRAGHKEGDSWVQTDPTDWSVSIAEGILSFGRNGDITLDGERLGNGYGAEVRSVRWRLLFWPRPDAIKILCHHCVHHWDAANRFPLMKHPPKVPENIRAMLRCLEEARVGLNTGTYSQKAVCACCGRAGGGARIPSWLWWIGESTATEKIEKELVSMIFERKLKDRNAELYLTCFEISYQRLKDGVRHFEARWTDKRSGEFYRSIHDEAMPAGGWERYWSIQELSESAVRIQAHDGTVLHQRKEADGTSG